MYFSSVLLGGHGDVGVRDVVEEEGEADERGAPLVRRGTSTTANSTVLLFFFTKVLI